MDINKFRPKNSTYLPIDYGFKAWAFDPSSAPNSYTPTSGASFAIRLKIDKPELITGVKIICSGTPTLLTGAYFALYQDNTKLIQSSDRTSDFSTIGGKTLPFTAPVSVQKGYIDVLVWFTATTTCPNVARGSALSGLGDFLTGTDKRYALTDTGLTTTAPSTLGTKTSLGAAVWLAVY